MRIQQHYRLPSSSLSRKADPHHGPKATGEPVGFLPDAGAILRRRADRSQGKRLFHVTRLRHWMRRSEPRKYIFKDGNVQRNKNPFALLGRIERESGQGGVVLFVAAPQAEPKPKKEKR